MHTVKPLDTTLLAEVFDAYPLVASVEEHSRIGGFGAAVSEWVTDGPHRKANLIRIGVDDAYLYGTGNQENARVLVGLTGEGIAGKILKALEAP